MSFRNQLIMLSKYFRIFPKQTRTNNFIISSIYSNNLINKRNYSEASPSMEVVDEVNSDINPPHVPVLLEESLEHLQLKKNGLYLDFTFGAGGHTKKILEFSDKTIVYGVDRDPASYEYGLQLQEKYPNRFYPVLAKFSELPQALPRMGIRPNSFDGAIMDLGVSTMQFSRPERGFMLSKDGPLDMRMDQDRHPDQLTAAEILENIDEYDLSRVLKNYGQVKRAKLIAKLIVNVRFQCRKLTTTKELADLVAAGLNASGDFRQTGEFHPATRVFMALRILVNDELNELDYGMKMAHYFLAPNGILSAISFHSLEDTIVKRHIMGDDVIEDADSIGITLDLPRPTSLPETERMVPWRAMVKGIITPSVDEFLCNFKSRSAKLRVASKNSNFTYV